MSQRFGFSSVLLLFLTFALWGLPQDARAQCDSELGCSGCATKGEKLKCKFDSMMEEGMKTIDELQKPPYDTLLPPAQVEGLAKTRENLDRGKRRLQSDDFHLLAKKRETACQLVESSEAGASHNDDGVCDSKHEDCAEVIGDSIGDDDGICWPLKGKKREVCVQICDEEAVLVDESATDENSAAELEGMYDTLTGHVEEVGETIPETVALIQMLSSATTNDPCLLQTTLQRHSYDTYKKARWAAVGSRAATDVAERFCDIVAGGLFAFSAGAACVAGESIAMTMNIWWEAINNVEAELDALTLDATITCAAQAADGAEQSGIMIESVQNTLTDVRTQNAEILRLIKIPPGQREEYPTP
jgi:hypothetical protein